MNDSSHSLAQFHVFPLSVTLTFVAFSVKSQSAHSSTRSLVPSLYPPSFSLQRPACMFDHTPSVHPLSHFLYPLLPSQPLHSPSLLLPPTLPPLSPTFYQSNGNDHPSLHLVIIRPVWCLVPALAHPLPRVCHRLVSIPLLYISSPPSAARLFGAASRHLASIVDRQLG
jgi:hypothetical protein